MAEAAPAGHGDGPAQPGGLRVAFRTRLTVALLAASLVPLLAFGTIVLLVIAALGTAGGANVERIVLFALAVTTLVAITVAYLFAAELARPLRAIATAVQRVSSGDLAGRIDAPGDDELARLAESHDRLAADLQRRNVQVGRVLAAMGGMSPREGADGLVARAAADARHAFELIDAVVLLDDPARVPEQEVVPGETRPLRAVLRVGDEELGVLLGRLPATRPWTGADQDLLELFASAVGVAVRNAQLFARVESQNAQLLELDAAKDDFLRGVSHNLQTPLTSIRAYADQLASDRPDRRLEIIAEQSERLSRMVRQLLTVTRLESGALRPRAEVVSLGTRARRAWEALGAAEVPFELDDRSQGWLAVADPDQLDQVLWALLDNAVKYGAGAPVGVAVEPDPEGRSLRLTVTDGGPGVADEDRPRLFRRFERGAAPGTGDGSGLGLWVSRELCRAMGGELELEDARPGRGAAFSVRLPAEPGDEG